MTCLLILPPFTRHFLENANRLSGDLPVAPTGYGFPYSDGFNFASRTNDFTGPAPIAFFPVYDGIGDMRMSGAVNAGIIGE